MRDLYPLIWAAWILAYLLGLQQLEHVEQNVVEERMNWQVSILFLAKSPLALAEFEGGILCSMRHKSAAIDTNAPWHWTEFCVWSQLC